MTTTRNRARRALTLVEILVVIGIVSILIGVVVVSSRALEQSQARARARQQANYIAAAIDRYATCWPRWEINGVTVSDRGWPDFSPWRLFDITVGFGTIAGFNDDPTFFSSGTGQPGNPSGIIEDLTIIDGIDPDQVVRGDVLSANMCLAYSLTSPTCDGQDSYLVISDDRALMENINSVDPTVINPSLPTPISTTATVFVDPWGTPYRYFWVYRDINAFDGFLPVMTADVTDPNFRKAEGFVIESAGPDRKFGNIWRVTPIQRDINEAQDNIVIRN